MDSVDDRSGRRGQLLTDDRLGAAAKVCWVLLDDGVADTVAELARLTHLGESSIRKALKQLQEWRYLRVERRPGQTTLLEAVLPEATLFEDLAPTRARDTAGRTTKLASLASERLANARPPSNKNGEQEQEPKTEKLGAQALVAGYLAEVERRGMPRPTQQTLAIYGRQVKALLGEGVTQERIEAGTRRMLDRGMHPGLLGAFVTEADAAKGETNEERLRRYMAEQRERGERHD